MLIVHKYGGSSVATITQIMAIAQHIKTLKEKGSDLVIVASAMGKTTNELVAMAYEISTNPSLRELDMLLATGEIQTVTLLSIALNNIGVKAIALSGAQAGILTTENFSRAFIKSIDKKQIKKLIKEGYTVIVAGFQGITESGDTTTLGRGGSDTTAVALASVLKCPCEIYTDVEGVFTTDPKLYKNAKKLTKISYDEMLEMAINGAKVLETRSVELAKIYHTKVYLAKALEKEKKGTIITPRKRFFEEMKISGLATKDNVCVLTFQTPINYEHQDALLNVLSENCQNFEMFNLIQTQNSNFLSLSCPEIFMNVESVIKSNELFSKVKVTAKRNLVRVTLVGTGLATHNFFIKKTSEILNKNKIKTYHILLSETLITFTINYNNKQKAVEVLVAEFGL